MYRGWKHSKQIVERGAKLPEACDRCTRPSPNNADRHLITDDNGKITIEESLCFYHYKILSIIGQQDLNERHPIQKQ